MEDKYCTSCNHATEEDMPRCKAGNITDMVTGEKNRYCFVERLDGIGRCGSMGYRFLKKIETGVEIKSPSKRAPKPKISI